MDITEAESMQIAEECRRDKAEHKPNSCVCCGSPCAWNDAFHCHACRNDLAKWE